VLQSVRREYLVKFREDARFIEAGVGVVPVDWVNQRLTELGESWRVECGSEGYVLPALKLNQ
jgi:hypothetical protein